MTYLNTPPNLNYYESDIALPDEPFEFSFTGPPPDSFLLVQNEVATFKDLPLNSAVGIQVAGYSQYLKVLNQLDIEPQLPLIINKGGGTLLLHVTPEPEKLKESIINNKLQERPDGKTSWGQRCFGPGVTFFTDTGVVKKHLEQKRYGLSNVVAIEASDTEDHHAVLVEDGYRAFLTRWALQHFKSREDLAADYNRIQEVFSSRDGQELSELMRTRQLAFQKSGLVIDAFCALKPDITRLGYRTQVQQKLQIPFGLRTFTDQLFLDNTKLLKTVDIMLGENPTDSDIEIKQKMTELLQTVDSGNQTVLDSWLSQCDQEMLALYRLLSNVDPEMQQLLAEHGIKSDNNKVIQACDGWFPYGQVAKQLSNVRLGTNMGSNNVAVIGTYNRSKHRILEPDEISALLN